MHSFRFDRIQIWVSSLAMLIGILFHQNVYADLKDSKKPTVSTRPASALGTSAITVNGSIHPYGLHSTYYFEYGPTIDYGTKTATVELPPRLAAFYRESWNEGRGGWFGGLTGGGLKDLVHHERGGATGGFVRFTEPSGHDHNHDDGIGTLHLCKYFYPGVLGPALNQPSAFLGGGDPDFRGAKVSLFVRGNDWVPNGSELMWWTQSQSNIDVMAKPGWERANWAYTGFSLNDYLRSGKWEKVEYRLLNDTEQWTFGGNNHQQRNPQRYSYWSIDESQRHLNCDFFHLLTFVDPKNPPSGAIDFDELEIAYRNYSLLLPSNGGQLMRAPASSPDDAATLTDGWRHGKQRMWHSAANPTEPLEFVYTFNDTVTIQTVQLHQNPQWPAKDVEVLMSVDGKSYRTIRKLTFPERNEHGNNFAFGLETGLSAKANFVKVKILSGYRSRHWGLGEIEVFGTGATMLPDDDLYHVNTDIRNLQPGKTYHYRLVASNSAGTVHGKDRTITVPADEKPRVSTRSATRITASSAKIEGRLNPLGLPTQFYFEYGTDRNYGKKSPPTHGGLQITPRTVFANLNGLEPGTKCHFRLVAVNQRGTSFGADATFQTTDN